MNTNLNSDDNKLERRFVPCIQMGLLSAKDENGQSKAMAFYQQISVLDLISDVSEHSLEKQIFGK